MAYQLAFLSTELREVFANAPVTPQSSNATAQNADTVGHRKPIEGDCPVCVMEFDQADDPEDIVWCKAACGRKYMLKYLVALFNIYAGVQKYASIPNDPRLNVKKSCSPNLGERLTVFSSFSIG